MKPSRLLQPVFISGLSLYLFSPMAFADTSQHPTYRYAQHHHFDVFYQDFKTALQHEDKHAVFKMTQMPFVCHAIECGALSRENGEEYDKSKDLSMHNQKEFLQKYNQVFTMRMQDFMRGKFMNLHEAGDDENVRQFFSQTEQVLQSFYQDSDYNESDVFSFDVNNQGKYQLQSIPYRP
ncbi:MULTISPECIES: hypothetical protein [Vitreoscilla]|uniref:Uncharacterized protein n=1 Tax=Vitreoscilla stercoraria TaxID=61 RepID=A0ABY4ECK5_VITST|nr:MULTISPECIES: hypothetical protein [Vitreoscilla]AUZ05197.2 hypothetical protein ADP71_16660 [Vitreoscilla sp. C1]UOO93451.1 hypothetical protein LVJ81_05320 [Vitreoscilla stercoraria]